MIASAPTLVCQKGAFILDNRVTYINCSYMSPMLKAAEKIAITEMRKMPYDIKPNDFFETTRTLRQSFGQLINTQDYDRIAIIPSVSYGIANVANNVKLEKGDKIIVVSEQFPSNYYAWQRVATETGAIIEVVEPPKLLENRGKVWNERILEAIDHNTKVVTMGTVHWADGTRFDLKAIRKATDDVNAWLVVDGTQSVGAMPFDVSDIPVDALICGGYKWLLGPYSVGVAYYGAKMDGGVPIEENWINRKGSEDFTGLVNYAIDYQPKALRYQVGEASNFILTPMLNVAIDTLNQWGVQNISDYCKNLLFEPLQILQQHGFWVEAAGDRGEHLVGVRMPEGYDIERLKERLTKYKVSVSVRGDAVRLAPNVYNTEKDVEKLLHCFIG